MSDTNYKIILLIILISIIIIQLIIIGLSSYGKYYSNSGEEMDNIVEKMNNIYITNIVFSILTTVLTIGLWYFVPKQPDPKQPNKVYYYTESTVSDGNYQQMPQPEPPKRDNKKGKSHSVSETMSYGVE